MKVLRVLRKGKYFDSKVDDDIYSIYKNTQLFLLKNGYAVFNEGYGRGGRRTIYLHSRVLNTDSKNKFIDHINRNRLDNRKKNLRLVTYTENAWNSSKPKRKITAKYTSKYKGVYWHPIGKGYWRARLMTNGKTVNIGLFNSEVEAKNKYDEAVIKYRGLKYMV